MNSMKMRGHIRVLTEKDGVEKVLFDVENAVTELFEEAVASYGLDGLYSYMSCIQGGQNFLFGNGPVNDSNYTMNYATNKNSQLTVYFLNLPDAEKAALSKKSNVLPLYTSDCVIDDSKIVGYATCNYTSTAAKEGYLTAYSGVNLVNPRRHTLKFKWNVGVMNGTYNAIAVGLNILENKGYGLFICRGLETMNVALGEVVCGGYFLRNGIKTADYTITEDNEILLGGADNNSVARNVLNLATGEITILSTTDHRYGLPLVASGSAQLVVGDYFVYQNNGANSFYRRPISSEFSSTATSTLSSLQGSKNSLFLYNGYLYIQKNASTFYAYNPTTFSAVSSQHIAIANCNLPTDMQTTFTTNNTSAYAAIIQVGENYLVQDAKNGFGIICSNPTDVLGSMIKVVPRSFYYNSCVINGTVYYFYTGGGKFFGGKTTAIYPTASGTVIGAKNGLGIVKENLTGNLLSFATFDTPQAVSTTEATCLEYYYTFEQ